MNNVKENTPKITTTTTPKKKYSLFKKKIDIINNLILEGYTYNQIICLLKTDYDLDIKLNTFRCYLKRLKESNANTIVSSIATSTSPQIDNSISSIKTEASNNENLNVNESIEKINGGLKTPTAPKRKTGISALSTPHEVLNDVKLSADKYFQNTKRKTPRSFLENKD